MSTHRGFVTQFAISDFYQARQTKLDKHGLVDEEKTDCQVLLFQGDGVGASLDISQSVHNEIGEKTDWQLVTNK